MGRLTLSSVGQNNQCQWQDGLVTERLDQMSKEVALAYPDISMEGLRKTTKKKRSSKSVFQPKSNTASLQLTSLLEISGFAGVQLSSALFTFV
jgi:hypothetical protein